MLLNCLLAQSKNQERHRLRFEFWNLLLPRFKGKTPIYQGISPSKDHWLSSGLTGISGLNYACLIPRDHAGIELAINTEWKFVIAPRSFGSLNDFQLGIIRQNIGLIYICGSYNKTSKEENKTIFDKIYNFKDQIEQEFGHQLSWERLDDKKMSRIAFYKKGLSVFDKNDWPEMLDFIEKYMIRYEATMRGYLGKVKERMKEK